MEVGRIIEKSKRGKEDTALLKQTISFPVFRGAEVVALVDISHPVDGNGRHAPISVTLSQFDNPEVERKMDQYFLGRKPFGEAYGGELWLHITKTDLDRSYTRQWEIVHSEETGDLRKYRGAIEQVLYQIPWGNQWHAMNDVLSFIDGMKN